jgi:hypothetical protein
MILTGSTIIVLMDEENEEEREKVTCPGSPVESMVEQRFKIGFSDSRSGVMVSGHNC